MYLKAVIKRAGYLLLLVLITALLYSWKVSWYEGCVRSSESKIRWADFLQDNWASSMFGTIGSVTKQQEESEDAVATFYLRTCRNLQRYELAPFAENQNGTLKVWNGSIILIEIHSFSEERSSFRSTEEKSRAGKRF